MNWKFAFRALTAELRRRANSAAPENNAMVKCGAVPPEIARAQAMTYNQIADDIEYLTHRYTTGREALAKIRGWATLEEKSEKP